jgi:hypothetical protein
MSQNLYEPGRITSSRFSDFSVVTDPIPGLVTEQETKDWFGITYPLESPMDIQLIGSIEAVSQLIRDYTGRYLSYMEFREVWRDIEDRNGDRFLRETPLDEITSINDTIILNKATSRVLIPAGPETEVLYSAGYETLPASLRMVVMELIKQQMIALGYEDFGGNASGVPPEKAVTIGTLRVEYAVPGNLQTIRTSGAGGLSVDALSPYKGVLDPLRSRFVLVGT